jgi:transposase
MPLWVRGHHGWGFPAVATGPVCWGPRSKAVAADLTGREHLPLERCAEAMEVLFDTGMSEETVAVVLPDAAGRLAGFMARLATLLGAAPVVHADDTSVRVGVGLAWVHTISTPEPTSLAHHRQRGLDAIKTIGTLDTYTPSIVHDGLATYDRLDVATNAQCGAHLLRYLDKTAKAPSQWAWARSMRQTSGRRSSPATPRRHPRPARQERSRGKSPNGQTPRQDPRLLP